jgi:hypothetical protein
VFKIPPSLTDEQQDEELVKVTAFKKQDHILEKRS